MSGTVGPDDDWRLNGQEDYLLSRRLRWERWATEQPSWDHDHCEFCFAKIWDRADGADEYTHAYVTADDHKSWVCEVCFNDFRERFRWLVVKGA